MIVQLLQVAAASGTILTGVYSLLKPASITGFTGLVPVGGRGITEIRAVLGGLFIALGIFPLVTNSPITFAMLGISYLGIASVRAISMFVDQSVTNSNLISLAVEILFGVLLVM